MRQWSGSLMAQGMACRLCGVKPLPEPMLAGFQLDTRENNLSFSFTKIQLKMPSAKMAAILSRGRDELMLAYEYSRLTRWAPHLLMTGFHVSPACWKMNCWPRELYKCLSLQKCIYKYALRKCIKCSIYISINFRNTNPENALINTLQTWTRYQGCGENMRDNACLLASSFEANWLTPVGFYIK